jgi:hypothetical protein
MLHSLLRYPSPGFPADLRTGHDRIDNVLTRLDGLLVGSAKVRRQTVIEVRDDLLEARERAGDVGADGRTALDDAIASLGPVEAIAQEQHAARAALFRRLFLQTGATFASLMLGFQLMFKLGGVSQISWLLLAGMFVFHFVFFGLSMGYVGAYAFGKSEPGPKDSAGTGAFVVYYPPLSQALSWLLAAVFASMGVSLGLGMIGMSAFTTFSPLPSAVMILLCVKLVIAAISAALFRARVDSQVLNLQSMFRKQRIGRDRVQSVQAMGLGFRLLWPTAFGETYRIIWRDESGISRRTHVSISQDMVHGDRLVAWLELSVAAREANKA